ncbi:MAG TPA: UrcA family protein [Steroidobacteraceae bacterium]|nr:UrcA family protein [Steroidobacteraceae bacterium]
MKKFTKLAALSALAAFAANIALADSPFEPRSAVVAFSDVDTSSAHGVAVLYQRLKIAAEYVCSVPSPDRSQLVLMQRYASCVKQSLGNAVADAHLPVLAAYAASRGIGSSPTLTIAQVK